MSYINQHINVKIDSVAAAMPFEAIKYIRNLASNFCKANGLDLEKEIKAGDVYIPPPVSSTSRFLLMELNLSNPRVEMFLFADDENSIPLSTNRAWF